MADNFKSTDTLKGGKILIRKNSKYGKDAAEQSDLNQKAYSTSRKVGDELAAEDTSNAVKYGAKNKDLSGGYKSYTGNIKKAAKNEITKKMGFDFLTHTQTDNLKGK